LENALKKRAEYTVPVPRARRSKYISEETTNEQVPRIRCARQKLVTSAAASTGADSHRVVSHPSDRRIFSLLWDLNYSAAECAARQTTTEAGFDAGLRICWISAVTRSRIADASSR